MALDPPPPSVECTNPQCPSVVCGCGLAAYTKHGTSGGSLSGEVTTNTISMVSEHDEERAHFQTVLRAWHDYLSYSVRHHHSTEPY